MGTTVALSTDTHLALHRFKEGANLHSMDEAVAQLLRSGPETIERLWRRCGADVRTTARRLGIRRLVAFGSRVWGAAHARSDVDLCAEFSHAISLFDLMDAQDALSKAFAARVDLHTLKGLRPRLAERVRREGVTLLG